EFLKTESLPSRPTGWSLRSPGGAGSHTRPSATSTSMPDIGAYFVLSHGSVEIARPAPSQRSHARESNGRDGKEFVFLDSDSLSSRDLSVGASSGRCTSANAPIAASAAGTSGYTAKLLNTHGPLRQHAAHAAVAAAASSVTRRATSHSSADAALAMIAM